MGINTRLGDDLKSFYGALLEGRSGVTNWSFFDNPRVYAKVGGDLSAYDFKAKLGRLETQLQDTTFRRLRKLMRVAPFSTRLSLLTSVDAWLDAGLDFDAHPYERATLVGGHNLNENYLLTNYERFLEEPDWVDAQAGLLDLDTDHAASIGEVLGCKGAQYTLGGACASANVALRAAVDEIRHHGHDVALVTGATLDFSPMGLHAMALMGAITFNSFNDQPERASRPYDMDREGFVPSHGTASLVVESLEHAQKRGARIHAEVLGVEATSDGCHLPSPSWQGQARTIQRLLKTTSIAPEQVNFVSAHATSTPLGDVSEIQSLHHAFGTHAAKLKINAPKSMLGHTCWSAPAVETVAAILQMGGGRIHGSINIDKLDPAIDLDVCADGPQDYDIDICLKNSFGFGGTNCCALLRRWPS